MIAEYKDYSLAYSVNTTTFPTKQDFLDYIETLPAHYNHWFITAVNYATTLGLPRSGRFLIQVFHSSAGTSIMIATPVDASTDAYKAYKSQNGEWGSWIDM